ncbi:MAG: hypothetical protein G01um101433_4 [Parcubacteria group bacterium Gr01-1014_33]|nr:MAG: hypothetical protein G01um101433_4 [Parcubacteria group bacterium Gr01-1014_33]
MKRFTVLLVCILVYALFLSGAPHARAQTPDTGTQDLIARLQAQVEALRTAITALRGTPAKNGEAFEFSRNLMLGSVGEDVRELQILLNRDPTTQVASFGSGAPGQETTFFGARTADAVARFQDLYATEVLFPAGLSSGTGFAGPLTRAKLNSLTQSTRAGTEGSTPSITPIPPETPPTVAARITVVEIDQPENSLVIPGATRVPFTRITVVGDAANAVALTGIVVERTGAGSDGIFSGVMLLDENGKQLGVTRSFNSDHRALIGGEVVIRPGEARTFTIAGNSAPSLDAFAGQNVSISIVRVNTPAAVSGDFPIVGARHTVNATLLLGNATASVSPLDPNGAVTRDVGTTGITFAAIRIAAGPTEAIRLKSIRWRQTGTAAMSDFGSVAAVVDGASYGATLTPDAQRLITDFGNGILIDKSASKDVALRGNLFGGSAGRTLLFTIEEAGDILLESTTRPYGISVSAREQKLRSDATSEFTQNAAFFDGSKITVVSASVTTVVKSDVAPSQGIYTNLENQPLGAFEIDVKGEAITVDQMIFRVARAGGSGSGLLLNATLTGPNGSVGPVDESTDRTLTFSQKLSIPVGKSTFVLRARVPTTVGNGTRITISTNPSNEWGNVRGAISGQVIALGTAAFPMNTVTVQSPLLSVSVSTTNPAPQTISRGAQNVLFSLIELNAVESGESVQVANIPLTLSLFSGAQGDHLKSCKLFDGPSGTSPLMSGTNEVNPLGGTNPQSSTFTFNSPISVSPGTIRTLALRCNVDAGATGAFAWGIAANSSVVASGGVSGATVIPPVTPSAGSLMTVQ